MCSGVDLFQRVKKGHRLGIKGVKEGRMKMERLERVGGEGSRNESNVKGRKTEMTMREVKERERERERERENGEKYIELLGVR